MRVLSRLGTLVVLPFGALYSLSEFKILTLTTTNLFIIAAALVVIDVIVFFLVMATFQRDEILTKWK
jgi:hypothetical protein